MISFFPPNIGKNCIVFFKRQIQNPQTIRDLIALRQKLKNRRRKNDTQNFVDNFNTYNLIFDIEFFLKKTGMISDSIRKVRGKIRRKK